MNPMTDMFDFSKSFEQFSKFQPDFANAAPLKAFTDMAAKYRAVTIEAMNKDAATLMTSEAQPTAYAKKAGEVAQAAMQDIPARLFAYAEVAKKAQTELFDTAVNLTPKAVEEAGERTKTVAKTAKKAA